MFPDGWGTHTCVSEGTPAMTDFLDETRREITDRLNELKPLVDEYNRLEAAAAALAAVDQRKTKRPRGAVGRTKRAPRAEQDANDPRAAKASRRTSGKPSRTTAGKAAATPVTRRARRRKGATRAAETLAFVQGQPGITIPELASRMGIKQNYLYRVLPGLEQDSKVEKRGREWYPRGGWDPNGP